MKSKLSRQNFLNVSGTTLLSGMLGSTACADSVESQPANILIKSSSFGGSVKRQLVGFSYEKSKLSGDFFSAENTQLVGLIRRIGMSLIRIGGNSADKMQWVEHGLGSKPGEIAPSDVDALASFLKATQWQVLYGINLAKNTPETAASEVAYVHRVLGTSLASIEIGNECDGYAQNGLRAPTYIVADFISEWSEYAAAIRSAVPSVKFSGPASGYKMGDWTIPFAASEGNQIDALTQHFYQGNGKSRSSTMTQLLKPSTYLAKTLSALQSAVDANKISGGFRLGEANSLYSGGAPQISDAHGSALWVLDFIMTAAAANCAGVNLHGGGDGTYNPFYTPLADIHNRVTAVKPVYYGMLMVGQIAPGQMLDVSVSTTLDLTAYAIRGDDGAHYLLIVNKDPTVVANASIDLSFDASHYSSLLLSGKGLESLDSTTLGGAVVEIDGSWSPMPSKLAIRIRESSLAVSVPAAAAALLKIN